VEEAAQEQWLRRDLAAHPTRCSLAYGIIRFQLGGTQQSSLRPLWQIPSAFGVDMEINGHDHDYERFAPQSPDGLQTQFMDSEFVVGTGGAGSHIWGRNPK
jgi:hypothetical protein